MKTRLNLRLWLVALPIMNGVQIFNGAENHLHSIGTLQLVENSLTVRAAC